MAKHRFVSEDPYLVLGSASAAQHLSGHDREKQCTANVVFLCNLYQEQNEKDRWYAHEQNNDEAWNYLWAIDDLVRRPGVCRESTPQVHGQRETMYFTNIPGLMCNAGELNDDNDIRLNLEPPRERQVAARAVQGHRGV